MSVRKGERSIRVTDNARPKIRYLFRAAFRARRFQTMAPQQGTALHIHAVDTVCTECAVD
jgi:hypothetical protein